jgi:Right handed beta helix region
VGGGYGIRISGDRNIVESNSTGPYAYLYGISIYGSGNLIRKNSVTGASDADIEVQAGSTETVVEQNVATHSFGDGIHVDAPGTLLRKNVANNNRELGIEAVAGVIDGGGNKARGNGDPLQCLNVFCK